jgi:hypothetical protein
MTLISSTLMRPFLFSSAAVTTWSTNSWGTVWGKLKANVCVKKMIYAKHNTAKLTLSFDRIQSPHEVGLRPWFVLVLMTKDLMYRQTQQQHKEKTTGGLSEEQERIDAAWYFCMSRWSGVRQPQTNKNGMMCTRSHKTKRLWARMKYWWHDAQNPAITAGWRHLRTPTFFTFSSQVARPLIPPPHKTTHKIENKMVRCRRRLWGHGLRVPNEN